MKPILPCVLTMVLALATGCSRPESDSGAAPPAPMSDAAAAPVGQPGPATASKAVQNPEADVHAQVAALRKAVEKANATVQSQTASITSGTQSLLDDAKRLLDQGQWSEALNLLNRLAGVPLMTEQQSAFNALKQQAQQLAQQAAASQTAENDRKELGDLLKQP